MGLVKSKPKSRVYRSKRTKEGLHLNELNDDVLLSILSHLHTNNINNLRLTSRRFHALIKTHQKRLYKNKTLHFEICLLRDGRPMEVRLITWRLYFQYYFTRDTCTRVNVSRSGPSSQNSLQIHYYEDAKLTTWTKSTFLNKTFDQCARIFEERSGGISKISVQGVINPENFESIRLPLNRAKSLDLLECRIEGSFTNGEIFQYFFAPKRSLELDYKFVESRYGLIDERFYREAAKGELILTRNPPFRLTDELLTILIERTDLSFLSLNAVLGPSTETLRNVVQKLLHSTLKCYIKLHFKSRDSSMAKVLEYQIEEETVEVDERNIDETVERTIRYSLGCRSVVLTTETCDVPICLSVACECR